MRALIDGKEGEFIRCLLENGDQLTLHVSAVPPECVPGDIVRVQLVKDDAATQRQREVMERLQKGE